MNKRLRKVIEQISLKVGALDDIAPPIVLKIRPLEIYGLMLVLHKETATYDDQDVLSKFYKVQFGICKDILCSLDPTLKPLLNRFFYETEKHWAECDRPENNHPLADSPDFDYTEEKE